MSKKTIFEYLRKEMKKVQDEKRYEHTLGVAYTAANLAVCHGADMERALIGGLLHDCAKCLSNDERLKICRKAEIDVSEAEKRNPFLLHAKVGAYLAREKYDIRDEEILGAIRYHTTGHPDMTLLEKIVFVADYIEPGRNKAQRLQEIRRMAFQNLDLAMLWILEDTLAYLSRAESDIDPATQETYDYYIANKKG